MNTFYTAILTFLASSSYAAIVENGPWTGNDYTDSASGIGVVNGIPTSSDPAVLRRLRSPLSLDTSIDNYLDMTNVKRVMSIFSADQWPTMFPHANSIYTYENFLKAVAKFPMFCNESALDGWSLEDTCKRELSTLFAHWGQETGKREGDASTWWTQALYYVREINRGDYKDWGWSNDAWPNSATEQYYGRGPM